MPCLMIKAFANLFKSYLHFFSENSSVYAIFNDQSFKDKLTNRPRWLSWRSQVQSRRGQQHSFVEIDHEIFSTVNLSLPLIQEGQLSVPGKRMCTILANPLED